MAELAGIPIVEDPTVPPGTFILGADVSVDASSDSLVIGWQDSAGVWHVVTPVAGEVVPTPEGGWCPHCPHPLAEHYREKYACMVSSETETWACPCNGPADR